MTDASSRLLVVGAGPKAAALSAKSQILRRFDQSAPEIWVVERHEHCANWRGNHGFTNGRQSLGTPPEKDVGFPYIEDSKNKDVTEELFRQYSWSSYLNFDLRAYGEWIDRGRPAPRHVDWAAYITSVLARSADKILMGNCETLDIDGAKWIARIRRKGRVFKEQFDGVVITGPGETKMPPFSVPSHRLVKFGDNFWQETSVVREVNPREPYPIIVIGGGETAAAIVSYMVDELEEQKPEIWVLTRSGAIFSRGEGYYENHRFTDSSDWRDLPEEVRREVIDRSDRGVFSGDTLRKLSNSGQVKHRFVEVTGIEIDRRDHICVIGKSRSGEVFRHPCQLVVLALGFDPFSFMKLLPDYLQERLDSLGSPDRSKLGWKTQRNKAIENSIQDDLSLPLDIVGAKLFLPMISGVSQGPGFPNLSCLGNLSDRILGRG